MNFTSGVQFSLSVRMWQPPSTLLSVLPDLL